jgi:hypothetical protein
MQTWVWVWPKLTCIYISCTYSGFTVLYACKGRAWNRNTSMIKVYLVEEWVNASDKVGFAKIRSK